MVVSAVILARRKLRLRLSKPHLRILNPKIWKFDSDMGNGCNGGGLGGERRGDGGSNLRLKGCGSFSQPELHKTQQKKNCGLELA